MDIDMSALRGLVREKEISFDLLVEAIESALLIAYHRTGQPPQRPGASWTARTAMSRCGRRRPVETRRVPSPGSSTTRPAASAGSPRPPPSRSSCSGCATPRRRVTFGEYAGREGDIVSGVVQQGKDPKNVLVDIGKLEAILPLQEQVPGEDYKHGTRLRCYVVRVAKGVRGPSMTLSRTHPSLVKKLFALEVPEIADGSVEIAAIAREAGHRTKIAVKSTPIRAERQGRLHRPDGSPGARRDGRAARREDRHRRLVGRSGRDGRERPVTRPGEQGRDRRHRPRARRG